MTKLRLEAPGWGRAATIRPSAGTSLERSRPFGIALALVCALGLPVAAQPKKKTVAEEPKPAPTAKKPAAAAPKKEQNFDFQNLQLNGRSRTPQLLYFLERANEELERASLEKRSFIPHLVRTVEEEAL
jgi:hypothetical protein